MQGPEHAGDSLSTDENETPSPASRHRKELAHLASISAHLGCISPRLPDRRKELGRQLGKVEGRLRSREALQHQHGACERASRVIATPMHSRIRRAAQPARGLRREAASARCISAVSRRSLGDLSAAFGVRPHQHAHPPVV